MDLPVNEVVCGDCLEVMRGWPDNCVDLVLTDPPYGIDYQSAWRTDRTQWKSKIANDTKPYTTWMPETYRILGNSGRLVCFYRWDVGDLFRNELSNTDYILKSEIIWDKIVHGMGDLRGEFAPQHESILYATKGRYEFVNKRPKTILRHIRVMPEQLKHPNEKPISLLVDLIASLTIATDLILDPFCGSGTTCVAAKMLGRDYIGIDISAEYCEIARQRIEAVETGVPVAEQKSGQMALFKKQGG